MLSTSQKRKAIFWGIKTAASAASRRLPPSSPVARTGGRGGVLKTKWCGGWGR